VGELRWKRMNGVHWLKDGDMVLASVQCDSYGWEVTCIVARRFSFGLRTLTEAKAEAEWLISRPKFTRKVRRG